MDNEIIQYEKKEIADITTQYIIVFHGKNVMEITKAQSDAIDEESVKPNARFIKINGQMINFASISQILSLDEYYRQYPDKVPDQKDIFKPMTMVELNEKALVKANLIRNRGILKGLLEYRDGKVDGAKHDSKGVRDAIKTQESKVEQSLLDKIELETLCG